MPLPLLIGGAILLGGWGAKKGIDAKKDFAKASEYNSDAKRIYELACENLNTSRKSTNQYLEDLGRTKLSIYTKSIKRFDNLYKQIKGFDLSALKTDSSVNTVHELLEMRNISISMEEIAGTGLASVSAGALAGIGAYGGAMTFAAASTGTAISSLTGVAATNATLAWFGGGSLAAGGMGMAGGMAVLGGVVAGPVLMVAGMIAAAKAEEARADAYSNYQKAKVAAEAMNASKKTSDIIGLISNEINDRLIELDSYFKYMLIRLNEVVRVNGTKDWKYYDREDQNIVGNTTIFAITLKQIMDFSIFDAEGNPMYEIINKSKALERQAMDLYEKISTI